MSKLSTVGSIGAILCWIYGMILYAGGQDLLIWAFLVGGLLLTIIGLIYGL